MSVAEDDLGSPIEQQFDEVLSQNLGNSKNNDKLKAEFNPLSANITKRSNTLQQFVGNLPTNCLSVFDSIVILALKGLKAFSFLRIAFL